MITSRANVTVRYAETDMMGVAYHGSYLPWLEIGRTGLLKDHGVAYKDLEAQGFFLPVLKVNVHYRRAARYDDVVEITTFLREKPALRIRMDYELRANGELIATGGSEHAFIDKDGRPVRPPAVFVELMDRLFGRE